MSLPDLPVNNTELDHFFSFLYNTTEGFVYIALKDINLPKEHPDFWTKKFFKWPRDKEEMITYVHESSRKFDVYSSPSLFRRADATKQSWLGSWCIWTEFDGNTPENGYTGNKCPTPSLRIRSSDETHEHWYWKLHEFVDALEIFEEHSRRISYGLKADTSTWNCNRVLRPPGTIHHKSGRQTAIVAELASEYDISDVSNAFPELRQPVSVTELPTDIPNITRVIAKYQWPEKVYDKFTSKAEIGKRSDNLCWLAHECAVMGLSDAEIMSVLINTDERWRKFTGRADRYEQLNQIIANTREKHPQHVLPVMGIWDFVQQEITLKWLIKGFLPSQATTCMVSPPGVGKTQFALQLAIHLALGQNFIGLPIAEPAESTFVSLEMPAPQLHYFTEQMIMSRPLDEKKLLNEKLKLVPLGRKLPLDKRPGQQALLQIVNHYEPDGLILDSLGTSTSGSTNDDESMGAVFDFFKTYFIMDKFIWFIHHFRKGQVGNKDPNGLDDLRGSGVIGQLADLVLSIEALGDDLLKIKSLKSKLSVPISDFNIQRKPGLNFVRVENGKEVTVNDNANTNTGKNKLRDNI